MSSLWRQGARRVAVTGFLATATITITALSGGAAYAETPTSIGQALEELGVRPHPGVLSVPLPDWKGEVQSYMDSAPVPQEWKDQANAAIAPVEAPDSVTVDISPVTEPLYSAPVPEIPAGFIPEPAEQAIDGVLAPVAATSNQQELANNEKILSRASVTAAAMGVGGTVGSVTGAAAVGVLAAIAGGVIGCVLGGGPELPVTCVPMALATASAAGGLGATFGGIIGTFVGTTAAGVAVFAYYAYQDSQEQQEQQQAERNHAASSPAASAL